MVNRPGVKVGRMPVLKDKHQRNEGQVFDPMETLVELAGGVYGDKTYIGRKEFDGVPKNLTIFQGPNGGFFYFHDGDKPVSSGNKVVRPSSNGGETSSGKPSFQSAPLGDNPVSSDRPKTAGDVLSLFVSGRGPALDANGLRLTVKQNDWLQKMIDKDLKGGKSVDNNGFQSKDGLVTRYSDGTRIRTTKGDSFIVKTARGGIATVYREASAVEPEASDTPKHEDTPYGKVPATLVDHIKQIVATNSMPESGESPADHIRRLVDLLWKPDPTKDEYASSEAMDWVHNVPRHNGTWRNLDAREAKDRRRGMLRNLVMDELETLQNPKLNNNYLKKERAGQPMKSKIMNSSYAESLVSLAEDISSRIAKAAPRGQATLARKKGQSEYFAVHEDDSGDRVPLPKERIYLKDGEDAPQSVFVQEGPRGGRFYEIPKKGKPTTVKPAAESGGSMSNVVVQPAANPEREVKPTPSTSQTMEVAVPFESTMAKIKAALATAGIKQAQRLSNGQSSGGYDLETHGDKFEVYGRGRTESEATRMTRVISEALYSSDLDSRQEDDHVVVEALTGDPMDELFGDNSLDIELDPLLSEKSWSHDEAILVSGMIAKGIMPSVVVAALSARRVKSD